MPNHKVEIIIKTFTLSEADNIFKGYRVEAVIDTQKQKAESSNVDEAKVEFGTVNELKWEKAPEKDLIVKIIGIKKTDKELQAKIKQGMFSAMKAKK